VRREVRRRRRGFGKAVGLPDAVRRRTGAHGAGQVAGRAVISLRRGHLSETVGGMIVLDDRRGTFAVDGLVARQEWPCRGEQHRRGSDPRRQ